MILITMETAETSHDQKTGEDFKGGQLRGDVAERPAALTLDQTQSPTHKRSSFNHLEAVFKQQPPRLPDAGGLHLLPPPGSLRDVSSRLCPLRLAQ